MRAKAAADLIQFVSRDFKDDTAAQPPKDEEDRPQIPAPTINVVLPILPSPNSLLPVTQFTVRAANGEEVPIEGDFTESSSSGK